MKDIYKKIAKTKENYPFLSLILQDLKIKNS